MRRHDKPRAPRTGARWRTAECDCEWDNARWDKALWDKVQWDAARWDHGNPARGAPQRIQRDAAWCCRRNADCAGGHRSLDMYAGRTARERGPVVVDARP